MNCEAKRSLVLFDIVKSSIVKFSEVKFYYENQTDVYVRGIEAAV